MEPGQTKERLLQAAEQFYAEHGFEGTSMRELTAAAGTNLAAVNYHFGSKKALLMELCRIRIEPINQDRMEMLEAARQKAGSAPILLEDIFAAFFFPVGRQALQDGKPNLTFLRMAGRLISENDEFYEEMVTAFFPVVVEAFLSELERTAPGLPPVEVRWRFHFAVSALVGALAQHHRMGSSKCSELELNDVEGMLRRLRDFVCAGFRAPYEGGEAGQ